MKKSKLLLTLLSAIMILLPGSILAQANKNLSLQEAIELGLGNSKKLKASYAKIEEAKAKVVQMKQNQLPEISASGAYMRMNQPQVDLKIPLGGGDGSSEGAPPQEIKVDQMMYGMVNASVPLFSGFRIRNGIESARFLQKAAELDIEQDKVQVVQNIIEAYYNLYKAKAAAALVNENLKQAQSRVKDLSNLEANGLLARNDYLKAELQQSNMELALNDAQNNFNIAQYNMNLLLGLDEHTTLIIEDIQYDNISNLKPLEEWQQIALTHRSDYLSLEQKQYAANSNIRAIEGEYYPSVAVTGGYVAGTVPNLITVTNAVNVGLGLKYNISSLYKTGSKVRQAKFQKEQLYWNAQELADGIKTQIYQAYENYTQALKKISVYDKAVNQANENYRITKNKYDNSLETTTNLLDADVAQLQANINYTFAKIDAIIAYNRLYETAGLINEQFQQK